MLRVTLIASLFLLAAPATAQVAATPDQLAATPLLTLQISEQLRSPPDEATLTVGSRASRPTAKAAMATTRADILRLVALIKANGILARDIQTEGINLNADYRYDQVDGRGRQTLTGYTASTSVRVKTRDIDHIPDLLDKLTAAGADSVYGPSFSIGDPASLRLEARHRAMARGLVEARDYARSAGFRDVELLSVQEGVSYRATDIVVTGSMIRNAAPPPPPPPPPAAAERGDISPGQIDTGVTLTLLYRMVR